MTLDGGFSECATAISRSVRGASRLEMLGQLVLVGLISDSGI